MEKAEGGAPANDLDDDGTEAADGEEEEEEESKTAQKPLSGHAREESKMKL